MKKSLLLIGIFTFSIFLFSCDEEPPPGLDFSAGPENDTNYLVETIPTAQLKNVLIEDLTGVRCNNCPKAAVEAVRLSANPRIKVMALYIKSSSFAKPYDGYEDLSTDAAEDIAQDTEFPGGLPNGYVDRVKGTSNNIANTLDAWAAMTVSQLAKTTPVNITLVSEVNADTSALKAKVELVYTEDVVDANHALIIALTESHIKGKQKMPDGSVKLDYIHNHVLRTTLTSSIGKTIDATIEEGRLIFSTYNLEIEDNWSTKDCHIVAIVQDKTTKEIIHVQEIDVLN